MSNTITYKNYIGSVEFSEEDSLFYGKVLGIKSLISYEGNTAAELVNDFHCAVDDYLETCKSEGIKPEVSNIVDPYFGSGYYKPVRQNKTWMHLPDRCLKSGDFSGHFPVPHTRDMSGSYTQAYKLSVNVSGI